MSSKVYQKKGCVYLHVGGANKIYQLGSSEVCLSRNLASSREEDPLDLGFMVVPDQIVDDCNGKILMIEENMIENEINKDRILFYQAIGYPASKNARRAENSARTGTPFSPEVLVYSGSRKAAIDVSNKRYVDTHNVIMDWSGKETFDGRRGSGRTPRSQTVSAVGLFRVVLTTCPIAMDFILHAQQGLLPEEIRTEKPWSERGSVQFSSGLSCTQPCSNNGRPCTLACYSLLAGPAFGQK